MKLTTGNAREGLTIVARDNPEWGTWNLTRDRNGWVLIRTGRGCARMLDEAEFGFWEIISSIEA